MKRLLPMAAMVAATLVVPAGAATIFTVIAGSQTGAPGQTVGWGYTITNTDASWLVVTSSEFDLLPNTQTSIGIYNDYIGPKAPSYGPPPDSTFFSQGFNELALAGTGSFQISGSANPGDVNIGEIMITYDLFSVCPDDPNFNPDTDTISNGNFLTANAQVIVAASNPEPASLILLGGGLLALGLLRRFRKGA